MDIILEELFAGMSDRRQLGRVIIRLVAATLLGAIIGVQREQTGKPAGMRTHMLVRSARLCSPLRRYCPEWIRPICLA